MHCNAAAAVGNGLDCSVHVPSDQCVLTNDCDDGVFIYTLKHITEVSHHDGCHLYHLPATAALINLFTHVNIITGILHQQELGYFCAKYFMGPSSRCAAVKWFITRASMKWFITSSAVKRSIGFTIGFHNPPVLYDFCVGNPISCLLTVGSTPV